MPKRTFLAASLPFRRIILQAGNEVSCSVVEPRIIDCYPTLWRHLEQSCRTNSFALNVQRNPRIPSILLLFLFFSPTILLSLLRGFGEALAACPKARKSRCKVATGWKGDGKIKGRRKNTRRRVATPPGSFLLFVRLIRQPV